MTRDEFKAELLKQYYAGKLITPKHDPANLGTYTQPEFRTVLSLDMASDFERFILSDEWNAVEYSNTQYPGNPYIAIKPHATSEFRIPASGVAPMDTTPSTDCDSLPRQSSQPKGYRV
ncbi:hypothetical protein ACFL2Q_19085 [Thermodesulfobacteriota bacterium]